MPNEPERFVFESNTNGGYNIHLVGEDNMLYTIGRVNTRYWAVAVVEALNASASRYELPLEREDT